MCVTNNANTVCCRILYYGGNTGQHPDRTLVPSNTADGTSHYIFSRTTFTQQVFLDHWECCNVPDQISVPAIMLYTETSQIFDKFLTQVYTEDYFLKVFFPNV